MNFLKKIQKNIIQPIHYRGLAITKQMPVYNINIGGAEIPIVSQWYKKLTTTRFLILNKKIALALIDLTKFPLFEDYLNSVRGKNSVVYYRNRVFKKGYIFSKINLNNYISEIYEINTSALIRGGRLMTQEYRVKSTAFDIIPQSSTYGVFKEKKLVAYIILVVLNEVVFIDKLLGHKEYLNDGIMYLLIADAIKEIYESNKLKETNVKYVIYDSFLTNGKGLTFFKKRFGFIASCVNWQFK